MIEVTKRRLPEEQRWYGVCRNCQSEATALRSDMNIIWKDLLKGREYSWTRCPVCVKVAETMLFRPIQ